MSSAGRSSPWSGAAVGRAATFVLPTVSVLVAALVFLGPGALRPAFGARVYGAPADGARALALRLEVVKSLYGVDEPSGVQDLLVEGSSPGQTLRAFHGPSGAEDGVVEALLEGTAPIRGPVAVGVTALGPKPRLLAAGEIPLQRADPAPLKPGRIQGKARGDLDIRVDALRGALAAPFPETLRMRVSPSGLDVPLGARAQLEVSGAGADVTPATATTDEHGVALFQVKALAHQIELDVQARAGDKSARWEGTLPVIPGAMWLGPPAAPGAPFQVISPARRDRAYVSFWTDEGRVAGAVVPLAKDALGFFAGEVKAPEVPGARFLYAALAGDPLERGTGSVGWPILPPEGGVEPHRVALLLDGLPAAIGRENQRAWTTRRSGLVLIGAAALAEVLLLLLQGRASQRKLDAHLLHASETMPEADRARLLRSGREHAGLHALTAVSLVGLAFAMVAALSTFR
jgi:hypothetical protein